MFSSGLVPSIILSEVMRRVVSAATMPPMEWPMRMVRTEGSMVGDGEAFSTSRSMIFSCNLVLWFSYLDIELG